MNLATLQRFCEPARDDLATPWSDDTHTYASNGHLVVFCPRIPEVTRTGPVGDRYFAAFPAGPEWFDVTPALLPARDPCTHCRGTGKVHVCEVCDGEAHVDWTFTGKDGQEYEETHPCPGCHGTGTDRLGAGEERTCDHCDGLGGVFAAEQSTVRIGGALFRSRYVAMLASLPGCKIAPVPDAKGQGTGNSGYGRLVFDGGEGVLMGMRE